MPPDSGYVWQRSTAATNTLRLPQDVYPLSSLADDPVRLMVGVIPAALLLVLQQVFVSLVAGVLPDPVIVIQECTKVTQVLFPWPGCTFPV